MKENHSDFHSMKRSKDKVVTSLALDQPALAEAQKGLTERPTRNIRTRIILGFFLLFLFSAGVSITYLMLSFSIDKKVKFMEWRWDKKDNWGQPGKRINARSERQPDPPQSGALPFTSVLRPQTVYDRPAE